MKDSQRSQFFIEPAGGKPGQCPSAQHRNTSPEPASVRGFPRTLWPARTRLSPALGKHQAGPPRPPTLTRGRPIPAPPAPEGRCRKPGADPRRTLPKHRLRPPPPGLRRSKRQTPTPSNATQGVSRASAGRYRGFATRKLAASRCTYVCYPDRPKAAPSSRHWPSGGGGNFRPAKTQGVPPWSP